MNHRNWRGFLAWFFFLLVLLFVWKSMTSVGTERDISYSEFKRRLHAGQIVSLTVRSDLIRGRSRSPQGKDENFRTVPLNDPSLVAEFEKFQVKDYAGEVDRSWFSMVEIFVF